MAQYSSLKAYIEEYIYTNGRQAITAAVLQDVLKTMTDELGAAYQFGGVVHPDDVYEPGDANVAFLAFEAGTYDDFGGVTLTDGQIAVLSYDGEWHSDVEDLGVTAEAIADALGYTPYELPDGGIPKSDLAQAVQDSLDLADSAVQDVAGKADKVEGATAGNLAGLDANGNLTDSGYEPADFATSAQGDKADSAYQLPVNGIPKTDMAQGVKDSLGLADTAVQPADLVPITEVIPAAATSSNQLADKDFVNSSIATATATFRGTYNEVTDLGLTTAATEGQIAAALLLEIATADNNDYCFVQIPTADATPSEIARIDRYKFNGTAWAYEYSLNNSGFTASQWAAINSGITGALVTKLAALPDAAQYALDLAGKQDVIDALHKLDYSLLDNTPTIPAAQVQSDWGQSDNTQVDFIKNKPTIPAAQVQSDWNEADTNAVDYIKNKPTIPAAQVQSDWAEADANEVDYIKNKPTIPQLSTDVITDRNDNTKAATPKAAYDAIHPEVVNHGTGDTTFDLPPNVLHIWGTVSALTLTLGAPVDNTVVNHYKFAFTSGATATSLSLPASVAWEAGKGALVPEANHYYEVSIIDNKATWGGWEVS